MLRALKLAVLLVVAASFPAAAQPNLQKAIFAGGCFWCTESDFDKVPGVVSTVSGYIGGKTQNPTYQQIGRGGTGHAEAVEITFDPAVVSYQTLVEIYWRTIDPTDKTGQFCDRGDQYRPEIFAVDGEQKAIAEKSRQALIDAKRFRSTIEVAERTAGRSSGQVASRNARQGEAPSIRAASSARGSRWAQRPPTSRMTTAML